ncbi:hypothetical protein FGO68_gene8267 [Halteria grandinella]|uniref:Uncharacterized protein n=1 Tax=Halteria grandinella TaxID=5974 RepID=A0A8J8N8R1_HALGN|nr:hypothetical protein FGO68_gene8267 [Halteria grandinella]
MPNSPAYLSNATLSTHLTNTSQLPLAIQKATTVKEKQGFFKAAKGTKTFAQILEQEQSKIRELLRFNMEQNMKNTTSPTINHSSGAMTIVQNLRTQPVLVLGTHSKRR